MDPGPAKQELVDQPLQEEIAALADVMSAVAEASGPLSQDEVDLVLGVPAALDEDGQS
jgi:hypothetical protein